MRCLELLGAIKRDVDKNGSYYFLFTMILGSGFFVAIYGFLFLFQDLGVIGWCDKVGAEWLYWPLCGSYILAFVVQAIHRTRENFGKIFWWDRE